jgi:1,4-dihydroxy-2-naphthoyl-CoA hydrolase
MPSGAMVEQFRRSVDFKIHELSGERVRATISLNEDHHQPFGIVHGGVYTTLVETTASYGAVAALGGGRAVGVSNHTDFLKAVRDGELRVEGTRLQLGRTMQLWQVSITDERDRLVAHGRVRLMNLDA